MAARRGAPAKVGGENSRRVRVADAVGCVQVDWPSASVGVTREWHVRHLWVEQMNQTRCSAFIPRPRGRPQPANLGTIAATAQLSTTSTLEWAYVQARPVWALDKPPSASRVTAPSSL